MILRSRLSAIAQLSGNYSIYRYISIVALSTLVLAGLLVACGGGPVGKDTPVEPDTAPTFGAQKVSDQTYGAWNAIGTFALPEATGGNGTLTYSLKPDVPGLRFAAETRTFSGTPAAIDAYEMTYSVEDEDGDAASLIFMIAVRADHVFWTDYGSHKIQRANLDGSNVQDVVVTVDSVEPHGIAIDVAGNKLYWTEYITRKIRRANLDGTGEEDLLTTDTAPRSIALDVTRGKMYISSPSAILRANLDGSDMEELYRDVSYPTQIALDIPGGKVYWADAGEDMIMRANLDGTNVEVVEDTGGGDDDPYGVALDIAGGKIYWGLRGVVKIQSKDIPDGSVMQQEQDLLTDGDGLVEPQEIALDVDDGKIYWAGDGRIRRSNVDGTGDIEDIVGMLSNPYGIALAIS